MQYAYCIMHLFMNRRSYTGTVRQESTPITAIMEFKLSKRNIERLLRFSYRLQQKFPDKKVMTELSVTDDGPIPQKDSTTYIEGINGEVKFQIFVWKYTVIRNGEGKIAEMLPNKLYKNFLSRESLRRFRFTTEEDSKGIMSAEFHEPNNLHTYEMSLSSGSENAADLIYTVLSDIYTESVDDAIRYSVNCNTKIGVWKKDFKGQEYFHCAADASEIEEVRKDIWRMEYNNEDHQGTPPSSLYLRTCTPYGQHRRHKRHKKHRARINPLTIIMIAVCCILLCLAYLFL